MEQRLLFPLVLALALSACNESTSSSAGPDYNGGSSGGGNPEPPISDFDQAALVANLVDNVITPAYADFAVGTNQLLTAVNAYCAAEQSGSGAGAALAEARLRWQAVMAQWQRAEVMQLGPLLANNSSLRNKIYSWPVVSTCAVDQDVVFFDAGEINGQPYDIALRTETRKGLDGLEYLLFNDNLDHSCSGATAPAGWNERSENERRLARCAFGAEISRDLAINAQVLNDQWLGSEGYGEVLKQAGQPGNAFDDIHQAVNAISDGMFYIDSVTKDGKLTSPLLQYAGACQSAECLKAIESPFSGDGMANIEGNLAALKALFDGGDGPGFDDYLVDVGAPEVATLMGSDIDAALTNTQAYELSLAEALDRDPEAVTQTRDQIKAITDTMKVDFITNLALELPATSAGDND